MDITKLEKYCLSKGFKRQQKENEIGAADMVFKFSPKTSKKSDTETIYTYHSIFKRYKYIIFYKVSDKCLYFSLTNTPDEKAYKLSRSSKNVRRVEIRGENAKKLRCFKGAYDIHGVEGTSLPYFYISKTPTNKNI